MNSAWSKIKKLFKNYSFGEMPKVVLMHIMATKPKVFSWMSDVQYVKMEYKLNTGKNLNLDNPERFNEKLQWIKLNCHYDRYVKLVDKAEVKPIVASIIGEEHIIPTLGKWNHFEEIDFDLLPDQFVLKCTHDSGGIVICNNKAEIDKKAAKKKIDACMRKNYYYEHREWQYRNVVPQIIAEPLMVDEPGKALKDYKLFCFDGEVKFLYVAMNRGTGATKFDFYDENFNKMQVAQHYPNSDITLQAPTTFDEMKRLARILSKDIPFVRVDFYDVKGKVYFGELTFCHFAGIESFYPDEYDYKFGKFIDLKKFEKGEE